MTPRIALIAVCFALLLGCCRAAENQSNYMVDCSKNSFITNSTTRADLVRRFGGSRVLNGRIYVGEGESESGTIVFPGDPKKRLDITFGERTRTHPMIVRISGQNSIAATFGNIRIGTPLKQIEKINGRPFTLAGFEWDYSGTVLSWKGGKIDKVQPGCRIGLRLNYEQNSTTKRWASQVQGDRSFSSHQAAMQALNPRVYQIWIAYWKP